MFRSLLLLERGGGSNNIDVEFQRKETQPWSLRRSGLSSSI
jgi:hypothetical protein